MNRLSGNYFFVRAKTSVNGCEGGEKRGTITAPGSGPACENPGEPIVFNMGIIGGSCKNHQAGDRHDEQCGILGG
jgi:hypothetical protein